MENRFKSLFFKLFIPNLLIIFFFLCVITAAYIIVFIEIKQNISAIQEDYTEQSKIIIDSRINEAINAANMLKQLPLVNAFNTLSADDLEDNFLPVIELHKQLNDIRFTGDIVSNYVIVYKNSKLACTLTSIQRSDGFLSNFKTMQGIQDDSLSNLLFNSYYNGAFLKPGYIIRKLNKVYCLPILTSIGYSNRQSTAVIVMFIDINKIKSYMAGYVKSTEGNFLIIDSNNSILMSLNDDYLVNKKGQLNEAKLKSDYIIYRSPSNVIDWSYVLIQPKKEVFRDINRKRNVANITLAIVFFIGLLISLFVAKLNNNPVIRLLNNNDQLSKRIQNQMPLIQHSFLERWMKGSYERIEELQIFMKNLKSSYIGELYCVVVIESADYIDLLGEIKDYNSKELEIKQFNIIDVLTENLLQEEYILVLDYSRIAVIYISEDKDEEKFEKYLLNNVSQCKMVLENNNIENVKFGIGSTCKLMSEVSTSLNNAVDVLRTKEYSKESAIHCYEMVNSNKDAYFYPSEIEVQLYYSIRSGNYEQVEIILRDILNKNIIEKMLPAYMVKIFIYELWGTLAKVKENMLNIDEDVSKYITATFEKIDLLSDMEKIQFCRKAFLDLCKANNAEKKNRQKSVIENINDYVNKNYCNPNLGISMISDEFNLSNTYISQIFKEYNHVTFIDYIQKLRIDEAKRLVDENKMAIKDIVVACGYNSSNTFGKAFKRVHGVSASEYRGKK